MNRLFRTLRHQASRVLSATQASVSTPEQSPAARGIVSNGLRPLALEQRFMFDGAAVGTVADALHPDSAVHLPDVPAAVEVRVADPSLDHGKKEVVVVDTSVADYKTLEAGVAAGIGIVEIDGSKDGLAQLAKWAQGQSGYDSISILSHGSEAQLLLGTKAVTETSLSSATTQAELATIGQALTADGDLLLYGCDVAKGSDGMAFITDIAKATGADVAASSDRTGAASLSGDWVLEQKVGTTSGDGVFDQGVNYDHLLAAPVPSNYFYARPGEGGTSWIVPSTYTSSGTTVTDITGLKISAKPTTGVFEYSADGTHWSEMDTSTNVTQGQYLRFRDTSGSTTTYDTSTWLFWYGTVNGSAGSYSECAFIIADNAPTALTVNTTDIWGSSAMGDTLAKLNPTDTGMDTGTGRYVIESQSVANLFALGTSGTYTTLVRGTGSLPTVGQSVTVTVRYYDYWQLDASGDPIDGLGVVSTFTFTSRADPAGFVTETHVNTETAYSQTAPASAQLSDGSYVVVWTSTGQGNDTGSNAGIYAQKYSSSGDKIGLEIAISDQTVDKSDLAPTVTALDGGKFVVAYTQKNTDNDIVIRVVAADGTLGSEIFASTSLTGVQNTAAIAKLSNGNFVVSWVTPGVSTDIAARVFDSNGAALAGSEFTVNATTALGQILPSVAGLTDGNYVVVWRDASNASNNGDVYGRVMSASGVVSGEIKVAEGTNAQTLPKVTALTGGGFVVVFQEAGNTEGTVVDGASVYNIYAQRYDNSGNAQGSRILVNANAVGNQVSSTVSALGNGGFVVGWLSNSDPDAANDVFARRFDASGVATDAYDLLVNENGRTGNQTAPNVAALGTADGFTVSWSDPNGDASETLTAGKVGVLNRAFVVVPGPTITSAATASFSENGSGAAYTAAATASSGTVAYALSGADASLFSIDSSSGAVSFKSSPNYEAPSDSGADNVYDIIVSATDSSGTRSKNVAITVTNVNEAPVITSSAAVLVAENSIGTVYTAADVDPDSGQTTSWSISGSDASLFNINSSSGAVSFKTAPNYEAPSDAGGNNVYDINVIATDNGTGALSASKAVAITVTNVVELPTTTVASASLSVDTGFSSSDFITHTASQTVSGTLSANLASGERVQVSYDNGSTWSDATSYAVGSSSWSATTTLSGSSTFQARVTNADGSSAAYSHSYTLDTTAPTAAVSSLSLSADTGSSNTDFITHTASQTITATLSAAPTGSDTVYGSLDNGAHWIDITSKVSGTTLTWTGVTLAGSNTFILKVQDAAGNDGAINSQAYVLDTTAPTTTIATLVLSNDTGASSTDFITNTASQTVSGTLSANLASDETVQVSLDNGSSWTAASATVGQNTWSLAGITLAGSNTLKVKVTDVAGNDGTVLAQAYVLDTSAPTTTFSNLALSADTGSSSTDFITRNAAQTITATLSAVPAGSDVVYGSLDNGATWTDITSKVSGTTLTWNGVTLAGSNTFILKVQDAAGNDGVVFTQVYTLDTTAPTNSATSAALSNDSGTSSNDFVTNAASQTISGSLSANLVTGETVYVSLNNGATWTAAAATVGQNTWSLAGITLAGSSTLKVKVTDVAGNDGAVLAQAYVLDTSAPTTTFSNLALSADTGSSNTDFITRTAAQTITATLSAAPAGSDTVYGSLDNGATWTDITSKVSGSTLTWSGVTLAGSNTLLLRVTDAAGNDGTSTSRAYTLDAAAPATPGTPVLDSASDTGMSNSDGITSDSTPTFTGSAENGSTVTLYDGATLLGTVTAGGSGWSFTSSTLAGGNHTITATATDAAGNVSAASGGRTLFIDTTAPATTSVSAPANGTYYAGGALDFTVNFNEAVTVDTTGGTPRIAMVVGSTTRYAYYLSGSGTSALTFRYVVPSGDSDSNGVTVGALALNGGLVKDTAGNDATLTLNSVGSTAGVNVDGSQPSIVNVSASTADGTYGSGQSITVTVDFSSAVTVDTSGGTPTLALGDGGSASYSGGSGSTTLSFIYTVAAGQNSADLDYASTSALILNGATIVKTGGSHQAASLTLATPGSAGSLGANKDIVIDSVAPAAPTLVLDPASDSGSSNSDRITNNTTPTLTGTAEAGSVVRLYDTDGSTVLGSATADGTGNWSITSSALTEGSHSLKATAVDAAGNVSSVRSLVLTIDTSINAPANMALADGASASKLITNVTTPTITGAAEANSTVTLYEGSTVLGTATANASGSWSITSTVLTEGSHSLTAKATDAAGNVSTAVGFALTVDTTHPNVPTLALSPASDSGSSNTDRITNATMPTITGTAEAGSTVTLYEGSSVLGTTTADGSGNWSITSSLLADGNHSLTAKATDTAGNVSAAGSLALTVDTAAPSAPTLALDPASDSGASNTDRLTNVTTPTITGTAEAGSTVTLYEGSTVLGTTTTDSTGAWSITSGVLADGSHSLTARATDTAGNVSAVGSLALTVDTTAPATPVLALSPASDSGASNTDRITSATTPTITGTAEAGSSVTLYEGAAVLGMTTADGSGAWSITSPALGDGSHSLTAKATDAAGNVSAAGSLALTVDMAAPISPTLNLSATSDSGASTSDRMTSDKTPTLTGSAEAGSTVTLYEGSTVLGTAIADGSGNWSITSSTLTDGSHNLTTRATDAAGNVSGVSSALSVTIDTAAPNVSTLVLDPASDSGSSSSDRITKVTTPTITGSAEAGSTVTLYEGSTVLGTTTADSTGAWSFTSPAFGDGSHKLTARASDAAGNVSAAGSLTLTVDTAAPATPVLALIPASDSGASSTDRITSATTPTLTGTAEAGSSVTLYEGSAVLGRTTADGSGNWSITSGVLADGSHNLTAKASDAAGNISAAGSLALTVDTTAPANPVLALSPASDSGYSNTDRLTNVTTPTITGTAEAGSTVTLYEGSTVLGSATADGSGAWAIKSSALTEGGHSLSVKATDIAGNASASSAALSLVIDTASPTAVISLSNDTLKAGETSTLTISFSEAVSDLRNAALTVQGGTLSGLSSTDGGKTWTATFTPTVDLTSTNNVISLDTTRVSDLAGNAGTGTTNSQVFSIDTHSPTNTPSTPSEGSSSSTSAGSIPIPSAPSPSIEPTAAPISFLPASSTIGISSAIAEGVSTLSGIPSDVSIGKSASAESSVRAVEQMPLPTAQTSPLSDSALVVSRGVPDLKLSETGRSEINIPADAFAHSDPNAKLSFSLSQADGSALPNWVQFDQASGKLIVQAPEGYEGVLEIRIVARDSKGHEAVTTFHIVVGKAGKALERSQPVGRASLSEQIHKAAHRTGGLRERLVAFAQTDEVALRRRA